MYIYIYIDTRGFVTPWDCRCWILQVIGTASVTVFGFEHCMVLWDGRLSKTNCMKVRFPYTCWSAGAWKKGSYLEPRLADLAYVDVPWSCVQMMLKLDWLFCSPGLWQKGVLISHKRGISTNGLFVLLIHSDLSWRDFFWYPYIAYRSLNRKKHLEAGPEIARIFQALATPPRVFEWGRFEELWVAPKDPRAQDVSAQNTKLALPRLSHFLWLLFLLEFFSFLNKKSELDQVSLEVKMCFKSL